MNQQNKKILALLFFLNCQNLFWWLYVEVRNVDPFNFLVYLFKFFIYICFLGECNYGFLIVEDLDLKVFKDLKKWVYFNMFCIGFLFMLDFPFLLRIL